MINFTSFLLLNGQLESRHIYVKADALNPTKIFFGNIEKCFKILTVAFESPYQLVKVNDNNCTTKQFCPYCLHKF